MLSPLESALTRKAGGGGGRPGIMTPKTRRSRRPLAEQCLSKFSRLGSRLCTRVYLGRYLRGGQLLQQRLALAEPRPFIPLHVPREGAFLRQQLFRPFASLFTAVGKFQIIRIVVQRLRRCRELRHVDVELLGALQLSSLRV